MAKAQFVSAGTPNFGLILKCLEPAYEAAKQSTQEYLANVETMLKLIASAIQGTVEDSTTTEEEILEALKKILQLLQQVDDKLDSSDPHNARSEGNGGIGGNSGYGGSFGNGGGSRADSLQSKQYQPVDQFNGRSDGGSEAAGSPASSATGSGAMASGSQEFGHDQKKTTSDGARDAAESNTYPIFNEVPLPPRPTTIGLDVDGNAKDDYSLNLTDGNTHAVIGADGSVTLTKRDNSTIPMPSDASKTGSASFDLDADNDGVDDVSMNSDSGANARFSVYEDEDSRYVALDYDNDGDYDVAVRVGDSEAAREAMRKQAEDEAWQSIAAKDPLGRTADELRALYEDRETIQLPERTTIQ
ncbi:hypothetical protein PL970_07110 [Bifidobacterium adolescentis]|nr:hypothetical protein [Bifidobacterium adolescentis]